MTQNKFTTNNNPTLVAVSSDDGETPIYLYADPITHGLVINGGSGGGGTQYTEGDDIQTNPIGTLAMFRDDNNFAKPVDNNNPLPVFGNVNATQSGPWTVDTGLTPLTDTELRASPVEVTGTVSTTPPVGGATEAEQLTQTEILEQLTVVLKNLIQSIVDPVTLDRSLNRTRQTAIVESGTITTVSTVTGVTTVTGLTNIDSYQGKLLMVGQDMSAWANTVRARIT
jgi:hypothetical protein